MTILGIDLSMASTGICLYDSDKNSTEYFIIGSKFPKKILEQKLPDNLHLLIYDKQKSDKSDSYQSKEKHKSINIYNILQHIKQIIVNHPVDAVCIEGISFGSRGSVIDLAGLNYVVRMLAICEGIDYLIIASPTQNKKFATGNGSADKDQMISAWEKIDSSLSKIPDSLKIDDLADAYFLARYGVFYINSLAEK
jgi:Holliday junction resolvasome RuvABC endonuclease subunit